MGSPETGKVFGPVPSRRLGRSLGVDIVPFKVCSFDCVYCQLGRTPATTLERREYCDAHSTIDAVRRSLESGSSPDYITLSGSGEPTLNSRIGDIIRGIKDITDTPLALLTNGSMFHLDEVREACPGVDLMLPSLDAFDEDSLQQVNRPHPDLNFDTYIDGLTNLRADYAGQIWLEVFVVKGVNDSDEAAATFRRHFEVIKPDRIQLNTAVRPTAESGIELISKESLEELASRFGDKAEVIADFGKVHEQAKFAAKREDVLEMLRRRPCTLEDICGGLAIHRNEALKYIGELTREQLIAPETRSGKRFYRSV